MTSVHVDAIKALVTAAGVTCYDTDVSDTPTFPYVVLSAPDLRLVADSLDDDPVDVDDYVQVTVAAEGIEQARWAMAKTYLALDRSSPTVENFVNRLERTSTGRFFADRDVTLNNGGGHPIVATDTYRYRATPDEPESS